MTALPEPLEKLLWNLQRTAAQCRELFGTCHVQPAPRRLIDVGCDEDRVLFNAVPGGDLLVDSTTDGTTQLATTVDSTSTGTQDSGTSSNGTLTLDGAADTQTVEQSQQDSLQSDLVLDSSQQDATQSESSYELVFIDPSAQDYQQLIDDLLSNSDANRQFEIHLLDANRDGIEQITEILAEHHDVAAVHLVSHGTEGAVQLGNAWLNQQSLEAYAGQLASWRGAFASDGDLLFYGCDLAAGEDGRQLIDSIEALCDCDVAASNDVTGSALLGGDWDLEYQAGHIEADVAFSAEEQQQWEHLLSTATFQQGVNSYTSTQDSQLEEINASTSYGASTTLAVDADDGYNNNESQGLIRFDNLFGNGPGQIPLGSTINSAELTIYLTGTTYSGTQITLHEMLIDWNESSTWNSLGNGVQTNDVEASSAVDSTLQDPSVSGARTFYGLAARLQDWSNGGTNYGWTLRSTNDVQIDFASSEYGTVSYRPKLTVNYTPPQSPVLDLDANDSSGASGADFTTSFTEGGGPVLIADADAALSDVDSSNLSSLTVTITNLSDGAAESLSANTAGTSISASYNSGTGVLTLSGADTVANYQQVLRTVSYNNTSQNPTTTARTITFQANDGSLNSNLATATVSMTAQNDALVLDLDTDDSSGASGADFTTTFTEGGGPVLIADADAALSDVDSSNLSSLTVTITNLADGAAESLSANTAGTSISASYNSGTGVLTLSGTDTVANYQQVLRTVSYNNTAQNPTTMARTITFQANDGSLNSNLATATVSMTAQNDAPVLDLDTDDSSGASGADFTTTFTENGGAVLIADADAALSDVDSSNLSSLTVTITNLADGAAESLSANTAGTSISASYNSGTGVLTLSGTDTVANYQQVLRTVSYNNTSQNPTTTARTITFQANEGSLNSNLATATVSMTAQNDAPVLDLDTDDSSGASGADFTTSFTEGGGPVLIADADAALSDVDSANLSSLTVTITNLSDGAAESLSANSAGTSITASYNSGTGVLTLSGTDTVANYQQVLRTVSYNNTARNPTTMARTITFQANDGSLNSNLATATVSIVAQNSAPVASPDSFVLQVGQPYTLTLESLLNNDSDVDSSSLSVELVSAPLHGTLVANPDGSLTYTPDPVFFGIETFTYRASDGDKQSEETTVTLNVQGNVFFPPSPVPTTVSADKVAVVQPAEPTNQPVDNAVPAPQVINVPVVPPAAVISSHEEHQSEESEAEARPASQSTDVARVESLDRYVEHHSVELVGIPLSPEGSNLSGLETLSLDTGAYWHELNSFRDDVQSQHNAELVVVGSAAVVTTALSVGYVVWTLKGGYLVASAMASTPLWRMVDPLPVLNDLPDNYASLQDAGESLGSIVDGPVPAELAEETIS